MFRRKAKGADEATEPTTATAAETEAEGAGKTDKAEDEAGPEASAVETDAADGATEPEAGDDETGAADEVEIPKQQTAEQAADNEAGEGARK
ncbi:hypothetical protein [Streptomyces ipomoeae]|uniref:hypothetical protein n=1 Tax=Streptomyces ipomoeae TaxID=103232 RepID=UPI00215D45C8|nr:hypothetical protein [Streptomyces ipomoeae]